jgi:hypothetical protein
MAVSVGISRIVVLADYPEDGTQLLREANVALVKLDGAILYPWLSLISKDAEASAASAARPTEGRKN